MQKHYAMGECEKFIKEKIHILAFAGKEFILCGAAQQQSVHVLAAARQHVRDAHCRM